MVRHHGAEDNTLGSGKEAARGVQNRGRGYPRRSGLVGFAPLVGIRPGSSGEFAKVCPPAVFGGNVEVEGYGQACRDDDISVNR